VVSTAGDQMATSHQRAQRRADASGASLISVSASSGAEGAVVFNTVINDDSTRRRAEDLDAEARLLRPPGHPGGAGPGPWLLRRPIPGHGGKVIGRANPCPPSI
jgi:hypothetical protein